MKPKVALARAKQILSPEIEEHAPSDVPVHIGDEDMLGWIVGKAYVNYLVADGLSPEKARDIVLNLDSNKNLELEVIDPNTADEQ